MKSINIKPYIHKNSDGVTGRLMMKIASSEYINNKPMYVRKYFALNVTLPLKYWDAKKCEVKEGLESTFLINNVITECKLKLNQIVQNLAHEKKSITAKAVYDIYFNDNYEAECKDYIAFVEKEIQITRKDFGDRYYNDIKTNLKLLKEYTGGSLLFSDITPTWLKRYRYYLEHEKKNKINSIYQKFSSMRKFLNEAIRQGYTNNYPFKNFQIEKEEIDVEILLPEELLKLQKIYDDKEYLDENNIKKPLPKHLRTTLHYYLRSCYTGLRMNDNRNLKKEHIEGDIIVFKTQKTDKLVRIPINDYLRKLLYEFENEEFEIYSNQLKDHSNRITKDIAEILKLAKIKKQNKMTFHSSRHTFAVVSLILGVPIEVVSKILGHSNVKTTQIYAKIVDSLVDSEMTKWNKLSEIGKQK